MDYRRISFTDAIREISGGKITQNVEAFSQHTSIEKEKPTALSASDWQSYGRPLSEKDIARLAASRKESKTASLEIFQALGCRMKDDNWIAFPYQQPGKESFYTVKLRHVDDKSKGFPQDNCVASNGFFNLQTVNALEDIYVVEGEPDVAILEEAGFRAVSVVNGTQTKFDKEALKALSEAPRIFLIGDMPTRWTSDDPGERCMDLLQKAFAKVQVENVYRIRFKTAKDVCELATLFPDSLPARIQELSEESLQPWVTKEIPRIHELSKMPQRWLVDRLLPHEGLTLIAGSQGSTKSLLAMLLGQKISASAVDVLGRRLWTEFSGSDLRFEDMPEFAGVFPRIPVLYLDRENPESEINKRREQLGIVGNLDFLYWGQWSKDGYPPEPDDPKLLEWARRAGGFFIFDSLQQWYGGANENDNTAMGALMRKFQRLSRACAGVLVLHHYRKEDAVARGGTSITSIPDMSISLTKEHFGNSDICTLGEIRFRMCPKWMLRYETTWQRAARPNKWQGDWKDKPSHWILFDVKSDNLESEEIQQKTEEEKALEGCIDAALGGNNNLTVTDLIGKCREAFPDLTILCGAANAVINKITRRAAKIGWKHNKAVMPRWTKESTPAGMLDESGNDTKPF